MSEKDTKQTNEIKPPKSPKSKNTLGLKVTLGEGLPEEKKSSAPKRIRPTTTSAHARVDMPGKLKPSDEKKLPAPASRQTTPPRKKSGDSTPKQKKGSSPSQAMKKTTTKASPAQAKTQQKGSAPPKKRPSGSGKVKGKTPSAKKSVEREKVVPPKIGSRRGYRPSLAFRLRIPVFLIAFVVCALALVLTFRKEAGPLGRYVAKALETPSEEVTITAGMSARSVSQLLKDHGIVDDDALLLQFFIDTNIATTLRSGTFVMERGMSYETIGKILTARVGDIVLVVSPSFTLATIDRYLQNRGYAKGGEFLAAAAALKERHSLSFAEGWLLSGEYVITQDDVANALAQAMFASMLELVQPYLGSSQVAQWGLEQILIVASMIQAETQNPEEMPLIASVIYNRLEAGQPLGIDATTRYEIDDWENPIPKKALEEQTPYNTRRKVGLPPSGICSPSKAAVEAALYPLESPYFYYLHGLDKRLYPAVTYDEHKDNIKAYR